MEREILFRGKRSNGRWVYGSLVVSEHIKPAIYYEEGKGLAKQFDWCFVNSDSIGQYIELKDKNKNKIFEGDILFQEQEFLGVAYISKRYGVSIRKKTTTWSLVNFVLDSDFDTGVLPDIEVRGNIHDNPEIMRGGSNEA